MVDQIELVERPASYIHACSFHEHCPIVALEALLLAYVVLAYS